MSLFTTNMEAGVHIGHQSLPSITSAYGKRVQEQLLQIALSPPTQYRNPPGYHSSLARRLIDQIMNQLSLVALGIGIQTHGERESFISTLTKDSDTMDI